MALKSTYNRQLAESVWWNLFLLTVGGAFVAVGIQAVAVPHHFVSSGIMGIAMITWYLTDFLTVPYLYALLSAPLFIIGWFFVGRQFFFYSLYGAAIIAVWGSLIHFTIPVQNDLLAAVLAGVCVGTGGGIMLRSFGSSGGVDIIAIILRERYNISVGAFSFCFNFLVFASAAMQFSLDLVIISCIMLFINMNILESVLKLFNQRKMVIIISKQGEEICEAINLMSRFGVTFLRGKGGYSGSNREILLTVTNNIYLKELESIVFSIDAHALFVVENTFYVSGGQFSRKIYK